VLQPARFLDFPEYEQHGSQVAFGGKRSGVIRTGVPDSAFQHFSPNHACLLQMLLFKHDFAERAEKIGSHRMVTIERRETIESLV
jgi:hypothetical protein